MLMNLCHRCNLEHDSSYGSGKFCSKSCANKRIHSVETKLKIGKSVTLTKPAVKFTLICKQCNKVFERSSSKRMFCCRSCSTKHSFNKNREIISERMSIVALDRYQKNDNSIGWKSRTKLTPSYPEQYFIDLFTIENIVFEREVKINKYFIDFVIGDKIAVEIDGRRHNDLEIRIKDKKKDLVLESFGYRVIRIKWFNPVNEISKLALYSQIDYLKSLL